MCTQFCHILFYFLCTYVLNLLLFLFSTLYTRSNPGFTFTFLFLLITSSVLGKMFGYSSHGRRPMIQRIHRCTIQLVQNSTYNTFPPGQKGHYPLGKYSQRPAKFYRYMLHKPFSQETQKFLIKWVYHRCLKGELLVSYNLLH